MELIALLSSIVTVWGPVKKIILKVRIMTEEQREPSDFFLQMPRPCTPPEPSEEPCSALGKARLQKAVERVRVLAMVVLPARFRDK